MSEEARYTICGFEVGSKGTKHIQGYVYFNSAKSLKRLKKYIPRAHLEIARGSPEENTDYCSKEGDVWEEGTAPSQGLIAREKLQEIMDNPYENFHLYNQYRRAFRELKLSERKTHKRKLFFLDHATRFEYASHMENVLFMPGEAYHLYNDERIVITEYSPVVYEEIVQWKEGFPPSIRRGYEVLKFDPQYIFITYSSVNEYVTLRRLYKKYYDILDAQRKAPI